MRTLKTILKNSGFNSTGYIYRNGIHIVERKRIQNNSIELNYFLPVEISIDKKIARIIISDLFTVFPFGIPNLVQYYENNQSEFDRKNGIEKRLISIRFENGGKLNFEERKEKEYNIFYNYDITIQTEDDLKRDWKEFPKEWMNSGLKNDYEMIK